MIKRLTSRFLQRKGTIQAMEAIGEEAMIIRNKKSGVVQMFHAAECGVNDFNDLKEVNARIFKIELASTLDSLDYGDKIKVVLYRSRCEMNERVALRAWVITKNNDVTSDECSRDEIPVDIRFSITDVAGKKIYIGMEC